MAYNIMHVMRHDDYMTLVLATDSIPIRQKPDAETARPRTLLTVLPHTSHLVSQ